MTWFEIKTQSDIDHLSEHFGYFRDGCLREMHVWTGTSVNEHLTMTVPGHLDTNAKLFFQRQFNNPSAIEILFEGVTGIHITPSPENYDSIIRDAVVLLFELPPPTHALRGGGFLRPPAYPPVLLVG